MDSDEREIRTIPIVQMSKLLSHVKKCFPEESPFCKIVESINRSSDSSFQKSKRLYNVLLSESKLKELNIFNDRSKIEKFCQCFEQLNNVAAFSLIKSSILDLRLGNQDEIDAGFNAATVLTENTSLSEINDILLGNACTAAGQAESIALKKVLEQLLANGVSGNDFYEYTPSQSKKTILHLAVINGSHGKGQLACVRLICDFAQKLGVKNQILDAKDANEDTALHLAIQNNSATICRELINQGSDLNLRNKDERAIDLLYQHCPTIIAFVLDRDISAIGDTTNDTFDFNVDFRNIIGEKRILNPSNPEWAAAEGTPLVERNANANSDTESGNLGLHENTFEMKNLARVASQFSDTVVSPILCHPAVKIFLDEKWGKIRHCFWCYFALQALFYIGYCATMFSVCFYNCPHTLFKNGTQDESLERCNLSSLVKIVCAGLLVLNVLSLGKECIEFIRIHKTIQFVTYFTDCENCFQLAFFTLAFVTIIPIFIPGEVQEWQYYVVSVSMPLAGLLLVLALGNMTKEFGVITIYIGVYRVVFLKFLKVITVFSPVILSFVASFSIVFSKGKQNTIVGSITSILITIMGEFNFQDNFQEDIQNQIGPWYTALGQIQYVIFGAITTVVLLQVLLGYAVSDIQEIQKNAEVIRRRIQVNQLFIIEGICEDINSFLQWISCGRCKNGIIRTSIILEPTDSVKSFKLKHISDILLRTEIQELLRRQTTS